MRKYAVALWICSVLLYHGCERKESPLGEAMHDGDSNLQKKSQAGSWISREAAVSIAMKEAAKKYGLLNKYSIHPCELQEAWLVIFELNDARSDGSGPEYTIAKRGGKILNVEVVQHGFAAITKNEDEAAIASDEISEKEAIAITEKDLSDEWLSNLNVTACETTRTWRILYSFKERVDGFAPEFTVDKKTGKLILKKLS